MLLTITVKVPHGISACKYGSICNKEEITETLQILSDLQQSLSYRLPIVTEGLTCIFMKL